jgi:hypothetical protein
MTNKRRDAPGDPGWIRWIELIAGVSAIIVLTWSVLALWAR